MPPVLERFASFAAAARIRNRGNIISAVLIVAIISFLLWKTQWLALRPGLLILLTGHAIVAFTCLAHQRRLSADINSLGQRQPDELLGWFGAERSFVKRSALIENVSRVGGFLVLAYGVWISTRQLLLALALGVLYPLVVYIGIARGRGIRTDRSLRKQEEEIRALLED